MKTEKKMRLKINRVRTLGNTPPLAWTTLMLMGRLLKALWWLRGHEPHRARVGIKNDWKGMLCHSPSTFTASMINKS